MNRLQTIELTGQSGENYSFTLYEVVPCFHRPVPCVYYVARRYAAERGECVHKPIFIGQTDDFDKCFARHPEYPFFKRHNFNCVAILPLHDATLRAGVKLDLINGLQPVHNQPLHPQWQPATSYWSLVAFAH